MAAAVSPWPLPRAAGGSCPSSATWLAALLSAPPATALRKNEHTCADCARDWPQPPIAQRLPPPRGPGRLAFLALSHRAKLWAPPRGSRSVVCSVLAEKGKAHLTTSMNVKSHSSLSWGNSGLLFYNPSLPAHCQPLLQSSCSSSAPAQLKRPQFSSAVQILTT